VRTGGRGKHNSFEFCGAFCSAKILHCFLLPQNTKSGGGESEGAAEGGCGGNSAAPELQNSALGFFSKKVRTSFKNDRRKKLLNPKGGKKPAPKAREWAKEPVAPRRIGTE